MHLLCTSSACVYTRQGWACLCGQQIFADSACSLLHSSFSRFIICRIMAGATTGNTVCFRHASNSLDREPFEALAGLRQSCRSVPGCSHHVVNDLHTYSNFKIGLHPSPREEERGHCGREWWTDGGGIQGWHKGFHEGLWHPHLTESQARLNLVYAASMKSSYSSPRGFIEGLWAQR